MRLRISVDATTSQNTTALVERSDVMAGEITSGREFAGGELC
jgi:hypothetical protein